jgi:hypothetical protein
VRSLVAVLVCLALAGCHRSIQNEDAVKQGVMDYLSTRQDLNLASMNVSVTSMTFRQDQANVMVTFAPKGEGPAQPMSIAYTLERKGDRWVVKPRAAGGQNPHGGPGASPHEGLGTSPHGGVAPEDGGAPAGALPPGHPTAPPPGNDPK